MYHKKPPFEITASILDKIAEIAELVGQVNAVAGLTTPPAAPNKPYPYHIFLPGY